MTTARSFCCVRKCRDWIAVTVAQSLDGVGISKTVPLAGSSLPACPRDVGRLAVVAADIAVTVGVVLTGSLFVAMGAGRVEVMQAMVPSVSARIINIILFTGSPLLVVSSSAYGKNGKNVFTVHVTLPFLPQGTWE